MYRKQLILTIITVLITGWTAGWLLTDRLKRLSPTEYTKLDECIDSASAFDAVFFGDSRLMYGANTPYFDSLTGMHSYNVALAGSQLDEMHFLAERYLAKHPPPRAVFIGLSEDMVFSGDRRIPTRPYYFFYAHNDAVAKRLSGNGFPGQLIKAVPFLAFAYLDDHTRTLIFRPDKADESTSLSLQKGFRNPVPMLRAGPLNELVEKPSLDPKPPVASSEMLAELLEMTNMFRRSGSRVFIVLSPSHPLTPRNEKQLEQVVDTLETMNDVKILDFHQPGRFPDECYFDRLHLNLPGSRLFTKAILEEMQK